MPTMWLQQIVLGAVQGLTEFLPVSSSAHLILVPRFLGWADPGLAFDVALHMGTLLAVSIYFRKDLWALAGSWMRPSDPAGASDRRLVLYLLAATVPGVLAGLALEDKAETVFRSPALIACTLTGMGLVLGAADYFLSGDRRVADMTWGTALLIGTAQALALVPGISRSGATITAALALGFRRTDAARFSFLMSLPITAGAGLLKFREILLTPDTAGLSAGLVGSAATGFLAIWVLMRYVQTRRYTPFVIYRVALGVFILLNLSRLG